LTDKSKLLTLRSTRCWREVVEPRTIRSKNHMIVMRVAKSLIVEKGAEGYLQKYK
jgi:hypothetical protein